MSTSGETPRRILPVLVKLACLIALIVAANYATHWLAGLFDFEIRAGNEDTAHRMIMMAALVYALLLAIPFVPGAEIGLAMMAMLGPAIAFLVYVCTLAGLSVSFAVGRVVPLKVLIQMADDLKFERLSDLLTSIEHLDQKQRLEYLASKAPNRYVPFLLKYRYFALAAALNVPGNFLIGGGGGIALFAGFSRLYSVPGFLATIALAVAPVPLAVTIFGAKFLGY